MTPRTDHGFFTLEAVIAIAIVALALASFYRASSLAVRAEAEARAKDESVAFGEALLKEPSGPLPASGNLDGQITWTLYSEQIPSASTTLPRINRLLFVAQDTKGHEFVRLETFRSTSNR